MTKDGQTLQAHPLDEPIVEGATARRRTGPARRRAAGSAAPAPDAGPAASPAAVDDPFALHLTPSAPAARPASAGEVAEAAVERRGAGAPVDASLASRVGAQVGVDVSGARIHDDAWSQGATEAIGARAFAYGQDVFLGPGERGDDASLIAHELTHVAQQGGTGATPQAKIPIGASDDPAEAEADRVAAAVAGGPAAGGTWLVESGPPGPGQTTKAAFLARLRGVVTAAANRALGPGWSATDCPYIEKYLGRYAKESVREIEATIRKFAPDASGAADVDAVLAALGARVSEGIRQWQATKALPTELVAIDPLGAAAAAAAAATSAITPGASAPAARAKPSLGALRDELGPGQPLASDLVARMAPALGPLDHVRVHTGPVAARKAAEADAAAFVVGGEVVLGQGVPGAGSPEHDALMAHELAHAVEQRDAATAPDAEAQDIGAEESAAEDRADEAATGVVARLWRGARQVARKTADLVKRPLAMQRCATAPPPTTNTRQEYLAANATSIAVSASNHLRGLPFGTHEPSLRWKSAGAGLFAGNVADLFIRKPQPDALLEMLKPEDAYHLVDSSRPVINTEHGQTNQGENAFFEGVGITMGNALARRVDESLRRELPRYAQARYHAAASSAGPYPMPKADDIAVSHPIDVIVVEALLAADLLDLDGNAFAKGHPDLAKAGAPRRTSTRNVKLEPTATAGWYRLLEPQDATLEEIATVIAGSPLEAYRIQAAPPLYGVGPEAVTAMVSAGADLDEAALAQAAKYPAARRPPGEVLSAMRMNATVVQTSLTDLAKRFGLGSTFAGVAKVIEDRANRLASEGDAAVAKWDGHTAAQGAVLRQAASGLSLCGARLEKYAPEYAVDLKADPGAFAMPPRHRQILRESAEEWVDVVRIADLPASAEQRAVEAGRRSQTLDIEIVESQLADPQAAAHYGAQSATVTADFDPASMATREVDLRKKLGMARAQLLADPTGGAPGLDKTGDEARDLNFESHIVQNATALDNAWRALDDADGFWATVSFSSGDLEAKKKQGKGYYTRWVAIHQQFKDGKKTEARKAWEALAGEKEFQTFLQDVDKLLKDVAKKVMIAKIIAMVVITIASMGAGSLAAGFVGGTTVAEGVVVGGLAMGRTAGAIAGFATEVATFSIASNLAFSKDHSLGAIATEMGKNALLFGALRVVSMGMRAAGLGKVIKAGAAPGASTGAKAAKTSAEVFEMVAMGGAGYLLARAEGEIRERMGGKAMTQEEIDQLVTLTIVQTAVFAVVGRLAESPLQRLNTAGAISGAKVRMALAEHRALSALAKAGTKDPAVALEILKRDQALMNQELAILSELQARAAKDPKVLDKTGFTKESLDKYMEKAKAFGQSTEGIALGLGMKQVTPNHFECARAQIDAVMAAHKKAGSRVTEEKVGDDGGRTWKVEPKDGGTALYITEKMPAWATTAGGKRVIAAAQSAGIGDAVLFGLSDAAIAKLERADAALAARDVHRAIAEMDGVASLDAAARAKLESALAKAHGVTDPAVYRDPTATLPDGSKIKPNAGGGSLYYGSDRDQPADVFAKGLEARGNNTDLLNHVKEGPDRAFRGTTREVIQPDGSAGAGAWAKEGGWVYEIDGVRGWDANRSLDGRVPKPDGTFGGNPMYGEHEVSILAGVPPSRIKRAIPMVEKNGRLMPDWGNVKINPNYQPLP